jgi:cardiolipin synthase (CMP-forming)
MTTANKITIVRILLVPFFIGLVIYYARTGQAWFRLGGFLTFSIAAVADGVDGYIARRYNQRSELGAILDPLADKLLLLSAIILLSLDNRPYFERLPLWLTVIVLGRDAIIFIGMTVIHCVLGKVKVRPRMIGKCATVLLMATVMWILLGWDPRVLPYLTGAVGVCMAISALLYVLDGVRQLNSHPASAAAPPENRN